MTDWNLIPGNTYPGSYFVPSYYVKKIHDMGHAALIDFLKDIFGYFINKALKVNKFVRRDEDDLHINSFLSRAFFEG